MYIYLFVYFFIICTLFSLTFKPWVDYFHMRFPIIPEWLTGWMLSLCIVIHLMMQKYFDFFLRLVEGGLGILACYMPWRCPNTKVIHMQRFLLARRSFFMLRSLPFSSPFFSNLVEPNTLGTCVPPKWEGNVQSGTVTFCTLFVPWFSHQLSHTDKPWNCWKKCF